MPCRLIASLALVVLSLSMGCGGADDAALKEAATASGPPSDPAARVVYDFFEAVRQGHTAEANALLTPLSLERITALEMSIAPPGSATARFEVGPVKVTEADRAVVPLSWTDLDADGKPYAEAILCEVRMCEGGWRICGMAQDLGPDRPPMVMDFERPEGLGATATGNPAAAGQRPAASVASDPFQQAAPK
jgi:hypothetical protein